MSALLSSFGLGAEAAARIAAIGPDIGPDMLAATRALFAPHHDLLPPPGGELRPDAPYGEDPRQAMDICLPADPRGRPILLFVPGGGFVGGDKRGSAHIPAFFARAGYVAAAMNYRLAPAHGWPAGARDVAAALDHLAALAAALGADAGRIFVIAESAGAAHSAAALLDARFQPKCLAGVRAALLLSGMFELKAEPRNDRLVAYYGEPDGYADRSPLANIAQEGPRILLGISERDPAFIAPSTYAMAHALAERRGVSVPVIWFEGHNHVSPMMSLAPPAARSARRSTAASRARHELHRAADLDPPACDLHRRQHRRRL
ncbi:MAG: alpha/beta hydrolase fold domain-containing protein [Sphingomonas sp.]